jgi:hypothetical protein
MTNTINFGVSSIDKTAGIVRGVCIIKTGEILGHSMFADDKTLSTVLSACKRKKNLRVKLDHTQSASAIVGRLTNFRIDGDCVRADLELLKSSEYREYILELAEKLSDQFGLSIAFEPTTQTIGSKCFVRCKSISSADIVSDPAATKGLFDVGGATPTFTNTSSVVSVPAGHKPKSGTVSIVCPNCEKTTEFLSKLNDLHVGAANKLQSFVDAAEAQQRDNISSQNTEAQFQARLETQRLELEKGLEAKASVMACRMLSATGVKLSKIPDADTCMNSGYSILERLNAIQDPTEKGAFYQTNKVAIQAAFQRAASKNVQLENQARGQS